ncbi:DNA ligase D [Occallatibacter savannae]|uniref:DNA ligase D n=1 Tax=Occallatibacter savannae TaxID=1002691 RepID=UPI000D6889AF|nr:DNA ligase D [Occallatibacter savannae]
MARSSTRRKDPAKTFEDQLTKYREMRDFNVTAEPRGSATAINKSVNAGELPFVIQKHAASHLHYDFRLAWNGVLKSWAVAKGPSDLPADKRLAVQVEDHPIEYGNFEGTIPKGQYGGGSVMVWDFGTWEPLEDADKGLEKGHLKFNLNGQKLHGRWALVRMHTMDARPGKPNWLLIKDRDDYARSEDDEPITERLPDSAVTKRTIEQISEDNDRVWQSNRGQDAEPAQELARKNPKKQASKSRRAKPNFTAALKSLPSEKFPNFISPQLAKACSKPPTGDDWVHELKLDGYRIQMQIRPASGSGKKRVALLTRKGLDWTHRMAELARAAEQIQVDSAVLDGEVVVIDEKGGTSFSDLQAAFQEGAKVDLTYFAFDLLHLDGHNLRNLPLLERKKLLAKLIAGLPDGSPIHLSEHFEGDGVQIFSKACGLGAEGIISKSGSAPYTSTRGNTWLKAKCFLEQEFVISGFTDPSNGSYGIGALIVGYYENGKLRYAGRSGTGFTQKSQQTIRKQLDKLVQSTTPFADLPKGVSRGVHWVKPELVAQLSFATWTRDNLVRQASFKGLREDKPAKEVVREKADAPAPPAKSASHHKGHMSSPKSSGTTAKPDKIDLPITHPNKILDNESGMTKRDLAEYLVAVSDHMLPHIADRPLSVVRCPEGSGKPCFFQKHIGMGVPECISNVPVPNKKNGGVEQYLTLNSVEGLVGMAQMGVLEIHPWGSKNESLEQPDRIIFDMDPDEAIDWKTLAATAKEFRARLESFGLQSFLKTTGGKGLHVVAPIKPEFEWPEVKNFCHNVVLGMERKNPALYVTKMTKAIRKNRIYLDYLRNDRGSTAIAPYSTRARSGAPVALPLEWKEVSAKARPVFGVMDFSSWKKRLNKDPWAEMLKVKQRLTAKAISAAQA